MLCKKTVSRFMKLLYHMSYPLTKTTHRTGLRLSYHARLFVCKMKIVVLHSVNITGKK